MIRTLAVLLVPNWQIVEALRRLERGGDPEKAMGTPGRGVMDGVGTLLAQPHLLTVQVEPTSVAHAPSTAS